MRTILQLITVLFLYTFITSCKKDPVKNSPPLMPPVITPHDSVTRLSKLFFIDTEVSQTDTLRYAEYLYDSLLRVTTINWYVYNNNSPSLSSTFTFHYNENDSMAFKRTFIRTDPTYPDSSTAFYSYDNLLRLVKDSLVFDSNLTVHTYQYSNPFIVARRRTIFTNPAYHSTVAVDTGFIDINGQVMNARAWYDNQLYLDSFKYDNKPNPYYQLNIRSTYDPLPHADRFQDNILQKYNSVVASSTDPVYSTLSSKVIHSYTYTLLGFPNTEDISDLTPFFRGRLVFIYKKI